MPARPTRGVFLNFLAIYQKESLKVANKNSDKKYHFLYKTVNNLNGCYYYGMHSTNNLKDGYIGSGKVLRAAIRKYGKENFSITVIDFYDTREDLIQGEKQLITEQMIKDQRCYNISRGGHGGNQGNAFTTETSRQASAIQWTEEKRAKRAVEAKKLAEEKVKNGTHPWLQSTRHMLGKKHSQKAKQRISAANKGRGRAEKNSQYGTKWITNGVINKKIKKDEKLPQGFSFGRV